MTAVTSERARSIATQCVESRRFMPFMLCAALALRAVLLCFAGQRGLYSDGLSYHTMAVSLLRDPSTNPYFPPGYPLFLALVYKVLGVSETIGRASSILLFAGLAFGTYVLAWRIANQSVANIAVLLLMLYPAGVWQSVDTLSQIPTALCLVVMTYLALVIQQKPTISRLALLGAVCGWVILIRPSNIVVVTGVYVVLAIRTRRRIVMSVAFVLPLLIVSSWIAIAYQMTGRVVMVNDANAQNVFFGNNPYTPLYKTWWFGSHSKGEGVPPAYEQMRDAIRRRPKDQQDQAYRDIAIHHIFARPDLFVVRSFNRLRVFFAFDSSTAADIRTWYHARKSVYIAVLAADACLYIVIGALAVLFVVTGIANDTPAACRPDDCRPDDCRPDDCRPDAGKTMAGIVLAYGIPYWLSFSHPTYHFPCMPLVSIMAASSLYSLVVVRSERILDRAKSNRRAIAFAIVIFLYIQMEWIVMNANHA